MLEIIHNSLSLNYMSITQLLQPYQRPIKVLWIKVQSNRDACTFKMYKRYPKYKFLCFSG